jgi:hypothetical protein
MLSNTQYLSSLKKEQELKQKWEKRKKELEKCLDKLTKALNTKCFPNAKNLGSKIIQGIYVMLYICFIRSKVCPFLTALVSK